MYSNNEMLKIVCQSYLQIKTKQIVSYYSSLNTGVLLLIEFNAQLINSSNRLDSIFNFAVLVSNFGITDSLITCIH